MKEISGLRFPKTHVKLVKDQLIGRLIDLGLSAVSLFFFGSPSTFRGLRGGSRVVSGLGSPWVIVSTSSIGWVSWASDGS